MPRRNTGDGMSRGNVGGNDMRRQRQVYPKAWMWCAGMCFSGGGLVSTLFCLCCASLLVTLLADSKLTLPLGQVENSPWASFAWLS